MKKNVRKIPGTIQSQLKHLGRYVIAAYVRTYETTKLASGELKHLGISVSGDKITIPDSALPPARIGKYSDRNLNGYEVVRKDLKKQTHYHSVETPNWGDFSYGTHDVNLPYEKYPRDFHGPQHVRIKMACPSENAKADRTMIIFEVDKVLDQEARDFKASLLECLNLLQENVGACGVQKAGATTAEYLKTMRVAWEILPPGTVEEVITRVFKGCTPTKEEASSITDRYNFLMSLKPEKLIYGTSGFQRYFGALIHERLVIFENIEYGNAIYVMFEDWKDLSQRSRTELLSGRYGNNFDRVLHVSGWKKKVRAIIKRHVQ